MPTILGEKNLDFSKFFSPTVAYVVGGETDPLCNDFLSLKNHEPSTVPKNGKYKEASREITDR
jgi:hypothetical protein